MGTRTGLGLTGLRVASAGGLLVLGFLGCAGEAEEEPTLPDDAFVAFCSKECPQLRRIVPADECVAMLRELVFTTPDPLGCVECTDALAEDCDTFLAFFNREMDFCVEECGPPPPAP